MRPSEPTVWASEPPTGTGTPGGSPSPLDGELVDKSAPAEGRIEESRRDKGRAEGPVEDEIEPDKSSGDREDELKSLGDKKIEKGSELDTEEITASRYNLRSRLESSRDKVREKESERAEVGGEKTVATPLAKKSGVVAGSRHRGRWSCRALVGRSNPPKRYGGPQGRTECRGTVRDTDGSRSGETFLPISEVQRDGSQESCPGEDSRLRL